MTTLAELKKANTPATQFTEVALAKPGYDSAASFEGLQRIGKMFCSSSLVPAHFRGEANLGNTCIALEMALRTKTSPMMVLQNMYIVQGKPGWSTQFLIACFNQTGRFSTLRYEFEGQPYTDTWGCRATATELSTGEKVTGTLVTMAIAKKEGWYGKSGSKWQTMPEQMLRYRAAAWFIRSVAPEVAMGMHTVDELRDIEMVESGRKATYIPAQPVQPEPETEQEQPKKRGRKPKVRSEQEQAQSEQIEEAEEVTELTQAPSVLKSEARKQVEDACANFEDYPVDPDATISYVMSSMKLNREQATEYAAANAEQVLSGMTQFLQRKLLSRDHLKSNKEEVLHSAEQAAGYFGVTLDGITKAPLAKIQDPEQRLRQMDSLVTTPDTFLYYVGEFIRNN